MSRSRGPELVAARRYPRVHPRFRSGRAADQQLYGERVIHGEIYKARPDVNAVCHHHAPSILPFCIRGGDECRSITSARRWARRRRSGTAATISATPTLIVAKPEEGASLAKALGPNWIVLMRRHGATVAGASLRELVFRSIYSCDNARHLSEASASAISARSRRSRSRWPRRSHAAEHPHPRLGILGGAARKARREAGARQVGAESEAGREREEGRAASHNGKESAKRKVAAKPRAAKGRNADGPDNADRVCTARDARRAGPRAVAASAEDQLKVAIGQINNWENQPPTLGQDAGIFKKYGLVLETFGTAGAGETLQPIISGSADIGVGVGVAGVMRAFPGRAGAHPGAGLHRLADLYWYVRADSPIKALADATPANSVAYSTNGSSSHNLVLAFVDELGLKAKPTPTGSPPATLTAVMSGQIDIGWSAPPIGLQEAKDGKLRIIAHGSDAPSLRGQTVRVTIANANFLKQRPDVAARFMKAYRETVDWMYSDPKAVEMYAKRIDKPIELVKQTIAQFYPKSVLQTDQMADMPGILRDAVKLKYLREPLNAAQVTELVRTPPR